MTKKPATKRDQSAPASPASGAPGAPGPATEKKKLSLDITDVSEVLERKISP
ncbi:MAG TPA: hypothetical protein VFT22_43765 [Kofleriaceae bacterium]|nr:hypothetical protein [Kofleriaceae bacterium]